MAVGKVQLLDRRAPSALGADVKTCQTPGGFPCPQARAVVDGLPGDIVALALPLDVDKIREAGLIEPGWQARLPNRAVVAESVVALVTRPGNPKRIRGWDDLIRRACAQPLSAAAPLAALPATLMPKLCSKLQAVRTGQAVCRFSLSLLL